MKSWESRKDHETVKYRKKQKTLNTLLILVVFG